MDRVQTIAVIEDDADLRQLLIEFLGSHGFGIVAAPDWATFRAQLAVQVPDLVILDIGLPDASGYEIMQCLRDRPEGGPPIIIIITGASSPQDRSRGLDRGADDYVCKPFDLGELLSRVRAVLRRAAPVRTIPADADLHLRFGPWLLKRDERVLMHEAEQRIVDLTAMEFDLLLVMVQRPLQVLSRDDLLQLAHTRRADPFDRAIDVRITRLRKKLEVNPAHPGFIRTIRGCGYLFDPGGTV